MSEVRDEDVLQGVVQGEHTSGGTVHKVLLGLQVYVQGVLYRPFTRVLLAMAGTSLAVYR